MKKSFLQIAILLLLSVIIFMSLIFGLYFIITPEPNLAIKEIITMYLSSIVFIYLPIIIFLAMFKFSFSMGKKVVDIEQGYVDFNNDKTYYRDIIDEYGVLELAYIYNGQKIERKDIVATLLNLENKKVIKLQNNEIVDVDWSKLSNSEDYILKFSLSGKINIYGTDMLTDIVKQDAMKSGLIEKEQNIAKDIFLMFFKTNLFAAIVFMGFFFAIGLYDEYPNFITITLAIVLLLLNFLTGYRMIYFFSYAYHKIKSFKLTDKGKEIKGKLDGLNLYIKEFGDLDDEKRNSLELWEDYLIYSVIFGINKNIEREINCLQMNSKRSFKIYIIYIIIFMSVLFILFLL